MRALLFPFASHHSLMSSNNKIPRKWQKKLDSGRAELVPSDVVVNRVNREMAKRGCATLLSGVAPSPTDRIDNKKERKRLKKLLKHPVEIDGKRYYLVDEY